MVSLVHHQVFTLEADSIIARVWVGVSCLVGEQVNGSHSQEPPSTLRPGDVDGVTHTPVPQPASITHIHAGLPGQVKLSSGGEPSSKFSTLVTCFIEAELLYRHGVEDSAWKERGRHRQHTDMTVHSCVDSADGSCGSGSFC